MIPLRDSVRPRTTPFINWTLIAINIYIFYKEFLLPVPLLNQVFYQFGVIPVDIMNALSGGNALEPVLFTLISATFLHGGWLHVLSNMLYLFIFGDNVEDRLGHAKYLLFYLLVGALASLAHVMSDPTSEVPLVGASGAVAGVLGAYFITYPKARVLTLVPIIIFFTIIEVPAMAFLAIWFVIQVFQGTASLGGVANPVAWWAHVGGFLAGIVLIKLMASSKEKRWDHLR